MRLIDADTLRASVLEWENCYNGFSDTYDKARIIDAIDERPTIDAEPVKRGRWERCGIKTYDFAFYCSECSSFSPNGVKTKYCPWCGTKMEV